MGVQIHRPWSVDLAQLESSQHLKDPLSFAFYKSSETPSPAVTLRPSAYYVLFIVIPLLSILSRFSSRANTISPSSLLSRTAGPI